MTPHLLGTIHTRSPVTVTSYQLLFHYTKIMKNDRDYSDSHFGYLVAQQDFPVTCEETICRHNQIASPTVGYTFACYHAHAVAHGVTR